MLRNFSFFMVLIGMSTAMLQADYVIQLGLYKNRSTLDKMVNSISDPKLKAGVIIEKRGELHWAHSKVIKDKDSMQHELSVYREVFKDAFFKELSTIKKENEEIIEIDPIKFVEKMVQPDVSQTAPVKEVKATSNIDEKAELLKSNAVASKKLSFEEWLKGNVFYVCSKSEGKKVVKTEFDGRQVNYTSVFDELNTSEARYDVVLDRLYIFKEKISTRSAYSTLDEVKEKYLLIGSWENRKKVNTIRYYYNLPDAMAYVNRD